MTSFLYNTGAGVPGDINDARNSVVESREYDSSNMPAAFGAPVKIVSGLVNAIESGDAATDFYGILVRAVPCVGASSSDDSSFGGGTPNSDYPAAVAVGGPAYVKVTCTIGTPSVGAPVYMRVTEDLPALVGDLEADADGVANVLLTNVTWAVEGKDADNVSVVRIK